MMLRISLEFEAEKLDLINRQVPETLHHQDSEL